MDIFFPVLAMPEIDFSVLNNLIIKKDGCFYNRLFLFAFYNVFLLKIGILAMMLITLRTAVMVIVAVYSLHVSCPISRAALFINDVGMYFAALGISPTTKETSKTAPVPSKTPLYFRDRTENKIIRLIVKVPNNHQLIAAGISSIAILLSQKYALYAYVIMKQNV